MERQLRFEIIELRFVASGGWSAEMDQEVLIKFCRDIDINVLTNGQSKSFTDHISYNSLVNKY